jgi:hypothetical protein
MRTRRSVLVFFAGARVALAKRRVKHPLGFRVELPDGWTAENAEVGMTLLPPGVKVDPEREDNPEVYTIWSAQDDQTTEQEYIEGVRARFRAGKIAVEREGDVQRFALPRKGEGISGVVYTFDFVHPERKAPYRLRVFAMTTRGRQLLLIAQGVREKVEGRDRMLREIAASLYW